METKTLHFTISGNLKEALMKISEKEGYDPHYFCRLLLAEKLGVDCMDESILRGEAKK